MKKPLTIGTRASKLALAQTEIVRRAIAEALPDVQIIVEHLSTTGDKIRDVPLARIGGQGLFTKEIENALLDGRIDLAVHSLKDLPTSLPDGLALAAVSRREDPRDVLIARDALRLDELPPGAVVGTSSLRRRAQLLAYRADLTVRDIRGNLDTRLRKLKFGDYDAIIVARAGLLRLGGQPVEARTLPYEIMLPAVGQGALGLETRSEDAFAIECCSAVNDAPTAACVAAERAFLAELQGGCQAPIGAIAEIEGDTLMLRGMIRSTDGSERVAGQECGAAPEAGEVGKRLAHRLLAGGGEAILRELRQGE
ncbi:MAG: hydroxymethylbilane synthase [Planctomycetes bacterium]|nr:hydroxymethylbilane synthase [Planctomycetota bacterium]